MKVSFFYSFELFSADVPRKNLAPVFIVEEDIRPLDITANVERLIIKDMSNLSDMNLQHPELVALLIITEPKMKENEWIEIQGLMSRSTSTEKKEVNEGPSDDACICIVERTSNIAQDEQLAAQESYLTILQDCYTCPVEEDHPQSSIERSKAASLTSKLSIEELEDSLEDSEEGYEHKPKRQCFADRLKLALERGYTPDSEASEDHIVEVMDDEHPDAVSQHENRSELRSKDPAIIGDSQSEGNE